MPNYEKPVSALLVGLTFITFGLFANILAAFAHLYQLQWYSAGMLRFVPEGAPQISLVLLYGFILIGLGISILGYSKVALRVGILFAAFSALHGFMVAWFDGLLLGYVVLLLALLIKAILIMLLSDPAFEPMDTTKVARVVDSLDSYRKNRFRL